jgi:flagellar assembly protein FliH
MSSKIIPREEGEDIQTWRAPQVEGSHVVGGRLVPDEPTLVTAQRIEEIEQAAWEAGHARGLRDGQAEARAQAAREVQALRGILDQLAEPLAVLDETVEESLLELVLAVARQVIRRELRTDPGQIVATVREALEALPVAQREIVIKLHPEDAVLVREHLGEGRPRWTIEEDPTLTRGGCHVVSESSRVDATVERRLNAIAASLLGGEREDDSGG